MFLNPQHVEHRYQHGWHGHEGADPLGRDDLQNSDRIEDLEQHHRDCALQRPQGRHPATRSVEHRHEVRQHGSIRQPAAIHKQARIVGKRAVRQDRSLGKSRRTRRILDLRCIPGGDCGQATCTFGPEQSIRIFQIDHLADCIQPGHRLCPDLGHRITAIGFDKEQRDRPGLLQHIAQFLDLIGRVRRDQHQTGQPTGIFHQHPFRRVRRPNTDPFTGPEPR